MSICLVFTPANPRLYTLNTAAWLVLSLCDGRRSAAAIGARYAAALADVVPRSDALAEAEVALKDLEHKGIVERKPARVRRARASTIVDNKGRKRS